MRMNNIIEERLMNYNTSSLRKKENALKEIIQDITLCGLSKGHFFDKAAFYGGTALRIFYNLDRFSEDLDFALIKEDSQFELSDYFSSVIKELHSFGFNRNVEEKTKSHRSNIQSAFVKGNTITQRLTVFPESEEIRRIVPNQALKVKFEVDVHPALGADYEAKYSLFPFPYQVKTFDLPSLFSGKLHAIICRNWQNRVKGRDLYDYLFYLAKSVPFNLKYLKMKLAQSGLIPAGAPLTLDRVKHFLAARFNKIDFKMAVEDVKPFLSHPEALICWSKEMFIAVTENLKTVDFANG